MCSSDLNNFRYRVLDPALEQINDFGTVAVEMTPLKSGRTVEAVRFDWEWKTISEARETDEENERPAIARRKSEYQRDMPPLSGDAANDEKAEFDPEERKRVAAEIMKSAGWKS